MKLKPLVAAGIAVLSVNTSAEIRLNGFATLAGGMTLDDDESLLGYDGDLDFTVNSLVGIQATSDLGEGVGVTTQIVSRGNEDWDTQVEWAYISYEANDNLKILFGRQRIPFYMYSEYLDVGYAYHWINPPENAYSVPFDTSNGIGLILNNSLGSVDSRIQFMYGRNQEDLTIANVARASDVANLAALAWTLEYDWLSIRASIAQADVTIQSDDIDALAAGWTATGTFASIADELLVDDDKGNFYGFGVSVDKNNFLFVAELTNVGTDDTLFTDDDESYYISGGYRFGNKMVHINYGASEGENDSDFLDAVPLGVDPALDGLVALTAGSIAALESDDSYMSIGFKWDFNPSAVFKVEYTDFSDDMFSQDASLIRFAVSTVF